MLQPWCQEKVGMRLALHFLKGSRMDMYHLPKLLFAYDALEPYMDAATVEIHYLGHHQTYVDKLNASLADKPALQVPVEELLTTEDVPQEVLQNAGGHANHSLFWKILDPTKRKAAPGGELANRIADKFGGFSAFQKEFGEVAKEHFSNGWAWLATDKEGDLSVFSLPDHESPLRKGLTPLFLLDLWEHAYYLKHQNRRTEFVQSFWSLANWNVAEELWESSPAKKIQLLDEKMAS